MKYFIVLATIVTLCLFLGSHFYYVSPFYAKTKKAVAVLYPTQGNKARGIVTYTQTADGIRIIADITDAPSGSLGFHIHEFGDCSCADAECAGSHYNPKHKKHGSPTNPERHIGDLGNIEIDENGIGHLEFIDSTISLDGPHSIIGRAVVLHQHRDDLVTQPTGNAGARIACGVIGVAKAD